MKHFDKVENVDPKYVLVVCIVMFLYFGVFLLSWFIPLLAVLSWALIFWGIYNAFKRAKKNQYTYVEESLLENENVILKAELHMKALKICIIGVFICGIFITAYFIFLFGFNRIIIINLLFPFIAWIPLTYIFHYGYVLGFTEKRVIGKYGMVLKNSLDIPINKVTKIEIKRGLIARILGCGNIIISSVGAKDVEFPFIKNFESFRDDLIKQIEKYKNTTRY